MLIQDIQMLSEHHGIDFTFDIKKAGCCVQAWVQNPNQPGGAGLLGVGRGQTPDEAMIDVMSRIRGRLH